MVKRAPILAKPTGKKISIREVYESTMLRYPRTMAYLASW